MATPSKPIFLLWRADTNRWTHLGRAVGIDELVEKRQLWNKLGDHRFFVSTAGEKRRRYDLWLRDRRAEMRTKRLI